MTLLEINKGCKAGGTGCVTAHPRFFINKNFHQLSKGTRILKIGQHLAELGFTEFLELFFFSIF